MGEGYDVSEGVAAWQKYVMNSYVKRENMKQWSETTETNNCTLRPPRSAQVNSAAWHLLPLICTIVLVGCSSSPERTLRARYNQAHHETYELPNTSTLQKLDETATLNDYLAQAFFHHPGLRAAFDRWQASIERLPQARALEDPTLSFEYFIEHLDTRYQASLTQRIPAFGKRTLREKKAVTEAEEAMHNLEIERLALYERVVKAFQEYRYLAQATQVRKESLQLLEELEQVVNTRYTSGAAPFSELITTQMEKDRLANELASLQDERAARSTALTTLLNLSDYEILPWPQPSFSKSAASDLTTLNERMATLNPELQAASARITAEEYREKLARKGFLPDIMLGANWMVMPGMDGGDKSDVGLMAGITLPLWWGSIRAEIREAAALARAATGERDNRVNTLSSDLSLALFTLRDAERRIELFSNALIPKARQALEVATQEFSAGKPVFMVLIDAQRTLLEFKLMSERAKTEREIALAAISRLSGKTEGGL